MIAVVDGVDILVDGFDVSDMSNGFMDPCSQYYPPGCGSYCNCDCISDH